MKILVIDGQGGAIGRQLVKMLLEQVPEAELVAVGTNSIATANMLKGGKIPAATGENAAVVNSRDADVIVGPLGIVVADSLLGEVTPRMAAAVAQSRAVRVLIPMNRCDNLVAGVAEQPVDRLLEDAMDKILRLVRG